LAGNPYDIRNKLRYHPGHLQKIIDGKRPFPLNVEIDVTNLCNHSCKFCNVADFLEREKQSLSVDLVMRVLGELNELGTISINWTGGGEPLLYKNFEKVVKYSKNLGFVNGLMTNGALMHRYPEDFFIDNFKWVRVSMAGLSAETYKVVQGKNDFEQVLNNIDSLNKRIKEKSSPLSLGIALLVNKENQHCLSNLLENNLYKELDYVQLRQNMFDFDEKWWKDEISPWRKKFESSGLRILGVMYADNPMLKPKVQECAAHFCVGTITANGKVKFCKNTRDVEKFDIGDLNHMSLKEIWGNSQMNLELERSIDTINCQQYTPTCRNMPINYYVDDLRNPPWSINHEFL
jgi:MoaA/NifB/PqqE/SkfB family radical SAM enzyme|tara:strand:+ start:4325 stop:5365 length:1041 start_codon:yes stop_codon:yes gene_type:complete